MPSVLSYLASVVAQKLTFLLCIDDIRCACRDKLCFFDAFFCVSDSDEQDWFAFVDNVLEAVGNASLVKSLNASPCNEEEIPCTLESVKWSAFHASIVF